MTHSSLKKLLSLFLLSLLTAPAATAADRISAFVSILPQQTLVQQIGGDRVDVRVMVAPGASPATYEPSPRQMAALSRAAVYFAVGVPFERVWLERIAAANPRMKIVRTDREIEKIPMAAHPHGEEAHHNEGRDHDDSGGIPDPHVWLSPPLVKIQARALRDALQELDPAHRQTFAANHRALVADIDVLHAELQRRFADRQGARFMVFHPSWGYFARTYGLVQEPIELEGKAPKPAQLRALIEEARRRGIRVVFVQPQFSTRSAELIAREIGGRVAFADPLAADWAANLRRVAAQFEAALR